MRRKGIRDRQIGEIWFSPLGIYKHLNRLSKKIGVQAIEKSGKLKPVREARITAITGLAMFIMRKEYPTYVQLSVSEDSPFDSYICQRSPDQRGTLLISNIQVTSYRTGSKEDFLTQLKRTKVPQGYSKFPEECVVVVDLLTRKPFSDEELAEITKYLNENKTPFPVWTFRAISMSPDTIGEMIILNPELRVFPAINFGKVAYRFKELGYPDAVRIQWVANESQLREDEHTGVISEPPWNPDIEN
jgi:hypothetical protein